MASFIKIGLFGIFNYANDRLLQKCSFFVDRSGSLLYNKAIERKSVKNKKDKMISRLTLCISSAVFNRTFFNTTPPQKSKDPAMPGLCFFCFLIDFIL